MAEPTRPPRKRPAAFFRAVVAAAVAAAAPAAGCYDSSTEEDVADTAAAEDGRETGEVSTEDYGVPADGWGESMTFYGAPVYGIP